MRILSSVTVFALAALTLAAPVPAPNAEAAPAAVVERDARPGWPPGWKRDASPIWPPSWKREAEPEPEARAGWPPGWKREPEAAPEAQPPGWKREAQLKPPGWKRGIWPPSW